MTTKVKRKRQIRRDGDGWVCGDIDSDSCAGDISKQLPVSRDCSHLTKDGKGHRQVAKEGKRGHVRKDWRDKSSLENATRERSRVHSLRVAFLELQHKLPAVPADTKLSKLDILLLATSYIAHLTTVLRPTESQTESQKAESSQTVPAAGESSGHNGRISYMHHIKVLCSSGT